MIPEEGMVALVAITFCWGVAPVLATGPSVCDILCNLGWVMTNGLLSVEDGGPD